MKFTERVIYYDKMISGYPYYNSAKKIIQVILKDGQIDMFDFCKIVNDITVSKRMLATNLFSFHNNNTITFNSKLIENYFRENIEG